MDTEMMNDKIDLGDLKSGRKDKHSAALSMLAILPVYAQLFLNTTSLVLQIEIDRDLSPFFR